MNGLNFAVLPREAIWEQNRDMTHTETAAFNRNSVVVQGAMPLFFVELSEALGRYDDTREDAAAIARLIPMARFPHLLDICCGVGRLSHALADLGYDVLGIDLSIEQLEVARQSACHARFSCGDMADPPPGPFDALVNIYTSFGYAASEEKDLDILAAWRDRLRVGGRLVMELADLEKATAVLPANEFTHREKNGVKERLFVKDRVLHVDYEYCGKKLSCKTRLYSKDRLQRMLVSAGFNNVRSFGGFDLRAKAPTDNLVIVAERA